MEIQIENRSQVATTDARDVALTCLEAGVDAGHPRRVIHDALSLEGDTLRVADATYDCSAYDEVVVLGGGNAAAHVAAALEDVLGDRIDRGVVVTDDPTELEAVTVSEGDHPVPSERGVAGTRRLLEAADTAGERTLVLAAITGGGSALMAAPADGISLADLQATTDALLESGADIHEINAVRKHCSALKGGQLARRLAPATVVAVVLSDVVDNDLSVIASGPVAPDESTFDDALAVVDRYDIDVPETVADRLERGRAGAISETPGPDDPVFDRVSNHIVADGMTVLEAAAEVATEQGYDPLLLSSRVRGEAREAATTHVAIGEEMLATGTPISPPAVLVSGGETTVTVSGDGCGGPNQEFVTSAALSLEAGLTVAAVDTDGIDGASDAAGGIVDAETVDTDKRARAALAANDVTPYLAERNALIKTGPTGTNLNDLRVVVVEHSAH
ncbi:glycerate kinase type-2 family protein [Natronorubrum sulfidifaciens]|uniref:Hydroxypyruvate reductase n=1 Tax=Natronorubrum sulfidifaciens JCM 14089 TaxID=1230460 RepID=L9WFR6_9EURY|nr:DUF4147 domain-containing protein [Natronorubrum sulfidifaciens]ELY48299.1 hydroxypyruvate reductase [Natronorubrum sulfidifaciens JCM 14089]